MPTVAELSVDIDADDRATATLERVDALIKRLGSDDTTIPLDLSGEEAVQAELEQIQETLTDLDSDTTTIPLDIDALDVLAELGAIDSALNDLAERVTVGVDLDKGAAEAELATLRAQLEEIQRNPVNVDVDTAGAMAKIAEIEAALKAIPDETVTIEVDKDGRGVDELRNLTAAASRASTQVNALVTAILVLGPALAPLLAVALTGLGALGAGFLAAGAGATLFGAVAISNLKPVTEAVKNLDKAQKAYNAAASDAIAEKQLAKIKAILDSLSPSQRLVVEGFLAMRNNWRAFAAEYQPAVFTLVGTAMQFVAQQIPKMKTLMDGMVTSAFELQRAFIAAFNGPFWQGFMTTMSQIAGPVTTALGKAFGNIITGIAGILSAFAPFSISVAQGFQDMTARFSAWGQALASNPGFQAFIAYVRANLPAVMAMIGAMGRAFVALVQASAPIGTQLVSALTAVFNWIVALNQTNPNLLTFILRIVGVGVALLNLLGPILAVVAVFRNLGIIFGLLASPVGLVVAAFIAVVAAVIYAYTHFETFRNVVNAVVSFVASRIPALVAALRTAFQAIVTAAQAAWQWLSSTFGPAISTVVQFVVTEFNKFRDWASQNAGTFQAAWQTIVTIIQGVLTVIGAIIVAGLAVIKAVWTAVWPTLSAVVQAAWTLISGIISAALAIIRGIIQVFAGILAGDWSAVWNGLVTILGGIWTAIWAVIQAAWQIIVGIFQSFGVILSAIWQAIWFVLGPIVQGIWAGIQAVISAALAIIQAVISAFGAVLSAIWNAIWAVIGPPVQAAFAIVQALISAAFAIINALFTAFNAIILAIWNALWAAIGPIVTTAMTLIQTVITTVLTFIQTLWTTVWTAIQTFTQTVWTAIQTVIQTAITIIQTLIQTALTVIQTIWTTIWTAIQTFTQTVWTAIQTFIQTAITAITTIITNFITTTQAAWQSFWQTVQDLTTAAISALVSLFTDMVSQITSIITGLIDQMFDFGSRIVNGLADGIRASAGAVADAWNSVISGISDALPFSPPKEGPLAGRAYTTFRGQTMVEDLASGISSRGASVSAAMGDVLDLATLNWAPERAYRAITTPRGGGGVSVQVAPGAVVVQVGSGADAGQVRNALGSAGEDLAEEILTALRRR